jgi:pimeloyl-ACP methyl ester carboxylesterase
VELYYKTHPRLAPEDTLFLHGNLASMQWWQPMLSEWNRLGSQGSGELIFADWRGCGQNPAWPKDKPFTLTELAQDHLELLDRLGKSRVALVGHSLGGLIALQMMLLAPQRFSSGLLLDPVGARGVVFDDSMYEAFRQMAASQALTRTVILSTIRPPDPSQARVDRADRRRRLQVRAGYWTRGPGNPEDSQSRSPACDRPSPDLDFARAARRGDSVGRLPESAGPVTQGPTGSTE